MSSDGAVDEKNVDEENDANVKDGNSNTVTVIAKLAALRMIVTKINIY